MKFCKIKGRILNFLSDRICAQLKTCGYVLRLNLLSVLKKNALLFVKQSAYYHSFTVTFLPKPYMATVPGPTEAPTIGPMTETDTVTLSPSFS